MERFNDHERLEVEEITRSSSGIVVEYWTSATNEDEVKAEMEAVVDVYAGLVDDGAEIDGVSAVAVDPSSEEVVADYIIFQDWLDEDDVMERVYEDANLDMSAIAADDDDDVVQEEDEAGDDELTQAEVEQVLVMAANSEGISVDRAEHIDGEFEVDYRSHATTEGELAEEIGALAGGYAAVVDEGHGGDRMVVYGHDVMGDLVYTFIVESEWAEQYNAGEITAEEFVLRVLETVEEVE